MSEREHPEVDQPGDEPKSELHPTGAPPVGAVLDSPPISPVAPKAVPSDSTVGTGTSIALGCIFGTLVLIVVGLIFLAIVALLN